MRFHVLWSSILIIVIIVIIIVNITD